MTELARTPWVDRTLKNTWERIAARVPESWMPQLVPGRKFMIEELGCGHYGCVAPVPEEDMVFKITSDVSEARFVAMDLDMEKPLGIPEGIVRYYKIFALEDTTYSKTEPVPMKHRGRPLFVLWRQEAKNVGLLMSRAMGFRSGMEKYGYDEYSVDRIQEGIKHLEDFLRWSKIVRKYLHDKFRRLQPDERKIVLTQLWEVFDSASPEAYPWNYTGVRRIGVTLRNCWESAMALANTDIIYPIGSALSYYLDEGILLADVHLNNIGQNVENNQLMITDPGHAVEFHPQWAQLPKVPVI
jgi:hypothetical protein